MYRIKEVLNLFCIMLRETKFKIVFLYNLCNFSLYQWGVLFQIIIIIILDKNKIFVILKNYTWAQQYQPEHLGISHTAIEVGVQSGSQSAFSFSWLTFIASIQAPIVTSSLLNIRKLQYQEIGHIINNIKISTENKKPTYQSTLFLISQLPFTVTTQIRISTRREI